MNDADRRALAHLRDALPLTDDDYAILGECTELGQAALLLGTDESALEAWYDGGPLATAPISRVLSRAIDRADVADRVDARLAEDPAILADLVRAQITWSHPALPELLDAPDFRVCAAWMLAFTDPESIVAWLDGEHEPADVVEVSRAAAPSGMPELFDALEPWVLPFRNEEPRLLPRIEAALFVLAPDRWGRGYMTGDFDGTFLVDEEAMTDVIGHTIHSFATEALVTASGDDFEASARAATAGAAACLLAEPEEFDLVVEAFDEDDWERVDTIRPFAVAATLAEEEDHLPLVEAAAHDLLAYAGYLERPSPRQSERSVAELAEAAVGDGLEALAATAELAHRKTEEAARALTTVWADGPPLRSTFVSDSVFEALLLLPLE